MQKGIRHFKVGDAFDGFLLIRAAQKGTASNGKPFLTLFLVDQTGEIEAKLWDVSDIDVETFVAERIVKVTGDINEFRKKAQLRIKSIRLAKPTDGVQIADFLQRAPEGKETLQQRITGAIFEMENSNIQRIVRAFVQKYHEELFTYPAASSNHHAYVSGLAHHIATMLQLARKLCEVYPTLNKDLLYAGVILHDIGKIHELSGVVSTSYTVEGTLLGHISIMVSEIKEVAQELGIDSEEVLVLQHIVLSHHGKQEWGSPKPPLIKEAEILHLLDLIDAKMNMLDRALETTASGEFTERLFPFENRSFYKPTFES